MEQVGRYEKDARRVPAVYALTDTRRRPVIQHLTARSNAWLDWQENDLVFPFRIGTPMEPDNLRRSWGRIRKTAKLGDVRFHDIRHTCVSLLLDLGVPPHIVRDIVGHSDIEVTMTIYAHAALDEKRKALRKLGEALG
jgi:integrase